MSGGGGSGSDGGGDMQVSGAEAAYSSEKGISTHADTKVQHDSFTRERDTPSSDSSTAGGIHRGKPSKIVSSTSVDNTPVYQAHYADQDLETQRAMDATLGADTSMVGKSAPDTNYRQSEIEKGYTDDGQKLANVNGKYMTKQQMYNTGIIEKDPETGEDVQGRYTINANTGELERTDLSFADHWKNAPGALKASPTLRLLYASGKNIGEWAGQKGFEGYNEAGLKTGNIWGGSGAGGDGNINTGGNGGGGGNGERSRMNTIAPHAPYIVSGITKPTNSPAANWYQGLGNSSTNPNAFNLATEFAAAKSKQAAILGNSSAVGRLAANQTPYFSFLQKHSLTKGIL